jgi:hypothetical protein
MNVPENFFQWAGLVIGAVSAYYGALNAVKERLATLDANMAAVKERCERGEGIRHERA